MNRVASFYNDFYSVSSFKMMHEEYQLKTLVFKCMHALKKSLLRICYIITKHATV
jgi:hypothetical protein